MAKRSEIETWVCACALGDKAAFESLYGATSAKLFGVCLRVLNDRVEAEEVLQDVFVTVWNKADSYKVNGYSPMTWLITIARTGASDRLRSRKAAGGELDEAAEIADAAPGPEAEAIASSERARIAACLDALDADKAGAVRRAYLFGDTYQELASHYDVPLNTIRTWLRRSLLKLRTCLSHDG